MRLLTAALLVTSAGCSLAFSPPIRALHAGMPGRLGQGELELGGAAGGLTVPTIGVPHVGVGISDGLALEAGANLALLDQAGPNWALGWAGARLTRTLGSARGFRLIGDVELGAGTGAGRAYQNRDARWNQFLTLGIYEGAGLGLQWRGLGLYARGRLDASAGSGDPTTLWPTAMLGLEVRPVRWLSIGAGGGWAAYWNNQNGLVSFWFYQAQVALILDWAHRG